MTQTAWGIRSFTEGSYSPFNIQMPVLGPPWKVPFEFPLYQIIAGSISKIFDFSIETSGRSVSIFFFIATGLAIYYLCRLFFSPLASLVTLAIFFFNGFNMEYGSAVLIDYCAVFFCLGALLALLKFLTLRGKPTFIVFVCLATLGALVKITTSIVWVGLGSILACFLISSTNRGRLLAIAGAGIAHVPALFWTRWADHQKSLSPTTSWLTSDALSQWNFGTLAQRLSWHSWIDSAPSSILPSVIGLPVLVFLVISACIAFMNNAKVTLVFSVLLVAGPAIFANLYIVHDYYWIAVIPALFVLLAAGLNSIFEYLATRIRITTVRRAVLATFVAVFVILSSWATRQGLGHFDVWQYTGSTFFGDENERIAIETISTETESSDHVVLLGYDWNPRILYFANRRGLMIPPAVEPSFLQDSRDLGELYKYVYFYADYTPEEIVNFFGSVRLEQVSGRLYSFVTN
jgi:4-amino-4-deoxy-L-arabinose transferase-like glycosyltransferase